MLFPPTHLPHNRKWHHDRFGKSGNMWIPTGQLTDKHANRMTCSSMMLLISWDSKHKGSVSHFFSIISNEQIHVKNESSLNKLCSYFKPFRYWIIKGGFVWLSTCQSACYFKASKVTSRSIAFPSNTITVNNAGMRMALINCTKSAWKNQKERESRIDPFWGLFITTPLIPLHRNRSLEITKGLGHESEHHA